MGPSLVWRKKYTCWDEPEYSVREEMLCGYNSQHENDFMSIIRMNAIFKNTVLDQASPACNKRRIKIV